jgi:dienelactone hydrolase
VHTSAIEYEADGRRLLGHLAVPDAPDSDEQWPAVLVCHEGPGLDEHAREIADRLAELGYVAFALDYHGDGQPLTGEQMGARLGELMSSPNRTRALARAGLDQLLAHPRTDASRVAAIGYCFGGTMALELARDGADLRAVVGFHSGLGTAQPDASQICAKVLVCIGTADPFIPAAQRDAFVEEMEAGEVDWRMNLYGGVGHSFTNPRATGIDMPGVEYDQLTDERSWRAMLDLFAETIDN